MKNWHFIRKKGKQGLRTGNQQVKQLTFTGLAGKK
jgi:hypothetical protein